VHQEALLVVRTVYLQDSVLPNTVDPEAMLLVHTVDLQDPVVFDTLYQEDLLVLHTVHLEESTVANTDLEVLIETYRSRTYHCVNIYIS
jgi:hypothetical protein